MASLRLACGSTAFIRRWWWLGLCCRQTAFTPVNTIGWFKIQSRVTPRFEGRCGEKRVNETRPDDFDHDEVSRTLLSGIVDFFCALQERMARESMSEREALNISRAPNTRGLHHMRLPFFQRRQDVETLMWRRRSYVKLQRSRCRKKQSSKPCSCLLHITARTSK